MLCDPGGQITVLVRRARIWCAGGLVIAALTCVGPAHADGVRVPPVITSTATQTTTVQLQVPRGVRVTGVSGLLRVGTGDDLTAVDAAARGTTVVSVGERVVGRYPDGAARLVRVPLLPVDARNGVVALSLHHEHVVPRRCGAAAPDVRVELSRLVLQYDGRETPPASVGAFLGPEVTGVDVMLDADPTDDAVEAALTAVASLSAAYSATVPVRLLRSGDQPSRTSAGHRVVRIESGPSDAVAAIVPPTSGVPTLTLTGEGAGLVGAARTLGASELGLAALPQARTLGLAATDTDDGDGADADTTLGLDAFTATDVLTLGGWGVSSTYLAVDQDAFGGPVERLDLHLVGAHTAIAGYDARVDAYVNDELVSSQLLDDDPSFALDLTVPAELVHPDNGVELVLSALPACDASGLTATAIAPRLDVDTSRSQVVAVRGAGESSGFELFPQVLGHHLPVAVRDTTAGSPDGDQVRRAAGLVSALQRSATSPLVVDLLPPEELLGSTESGLLVGATDDDTRRLSAPLRLEQVRLIDFEEATFELGDDARYAALQVVPEGGRELLVLGGWTPDDPGLEGSLTERLVDQVVTAGWRSLDNDLLIVTESQEPFDLTTRNLLPQAETVAETRSAAWWVVGGLGLLLVLILVQVALTARRRRTIAALVAAESREELAGGPEPHPGR